MSTLRFDSAPRLIRLAGSLALASTLAACGGSGNEGPLEAYAVDRSITLSDGGQLPAALDTGTPQAVASAASLLLGTTDEIDDHLEDLGRWFARAAGACRDGGTVRVSETAGAGGLITRTLDFDQCRDDDDVYDGRVALSCASTGCSGDGRVVFGSDGTAFVEQDLDRDGSTSHILLGEIRFQDYSPGRDTGLLALDLSARFEDRAGLVGEARFADFVYERAEPAANRELYRYDGDFSFTAFRTPSGACTTSPGRVRVATVQERVYDDGRDQTVSGQLTLGDALPGSLSWTQGAVEARAGDGVASTQSERDFERRCDF